MNFPGRHAIDLVKSDNGIVVYSTCSLSPYQNESIVQTILDANPNVTLEAITVSTPVAFQVR